MNTNILKLLIPRSNLAVIDSSMTIRQGLEKMRAHGYSAIPVINTKDGTYCGCISEGDFLWQIVDDEYCDIKELEEIKITKIIKKDLNKAIKIDTDFKTLLNMIVNNNFVPVVDDRNVLMGIITRKAVINYFLETI